MKLVLRSNPNLCHHIHGISRAIRAALFFSTDALNSSPSPPIDSLDRRILRTGDPTVSVVPVLEQWLEEGKRVSNRELQKFIRILRKSGRFGHALQISQWMSDRPGYKLSHGDVAVRLDLTSRAHGLDQAEKYFDSIPETSRGFEVYGALLNCYAYYKYLEKAEAIMQMMREKGFLMYTLSYNVMLNLYSQMGKQEKVDALLQEMEEKGISCNKLTYKIQMNAYAANSNIEEMDKLLLKMEADPRSINWHSYVVVTNVYLKAGLTERILTMLKRAEQIISIDSRRSEQLISIISRSIAYESLISSYAAVGNKDEVHHLWNLYKNIGSFKNSSYLCMISALIKLDDVDAAERIWKESVSNKILSDVRVVNVIISAYIKKGLWEKAETFVNQIVKSGMELEESTLGHLATAYRLGGQMAKAVETIKKAISASRPGWKPNIYTFAACVEYLRGQGEVEVAEELLSIFREHPRFSTAVVKILNIRANYGNLSTKTLVQMEGDVQTSDGNMPAVTEFSDKSSIEL